MPDAALRLLRLLGLLQSRPGSSGRELAGDLGVTERTLRRDVERLRGVGYAITAAPGAGGGGYRLESRASLPSFPLDDAEAMAVAVALGVPARTGVARSEVADASSMAKLDRLLPAHLQRRVTTLRATTLSLDRSRPTVPTERLVALAECCHVRESVQFRYRSSDGQVGRRRAEPYRLVATDLNWYLVAFDLERSDWRTFRVDRMSELERTGHTFIARELADPASLVAQAVAVAPYRYRGVGELAAPADEVSRFVPSSTSMVEAAGTQSRLTFGANRLDWAAAFLIGLGLPFVVLEPSELRDHLLALGRRLITANLGK